MSDALPENLPDPRDVDSLKDYFIAHEGRLTELSSWLYVARRTMNKAVRDGGPVQSKYGTYEEYPSGGYDYPPEILEIVPEFGEEEVSFTLPTLEQVNRVLEIIVEAAPELRDDILRKWKIETKVNGRAVHEFVEQSTNTEMVARLKDARKRKTAFGVSQRA